MNVAVVGAGGVVGETILRVLEERGLPVERLGKFGSQARGDIQAASAQALAPYDTIFFAGGEDASARYVPALIERGATVIDNSATYRMDPGVPLIVPEVNPHALRPEHHLLPVGNCTAILLCVALAPIRDAAGLLSVQAATYQAVSGAGRAALEAFDRGESNVVRNVVPQIGSLDDCGDTVEEKKIREETRKVLELPRLDLWATAVRVPVRTAHSAVLFFETERETSVPELADALDGAAGVRFHREGIVTPREVEDTDDVHVARLRACDDERGTRFQLWIVGDQLRKGAATNGVQILELVLAARSA